MLFCRQRCRPSVWWRTPPGLNPSRGRQGALHYLAATPPAQTRARLFGSDSSTVNHTSQTRLETPCGAEPIWGQRLNGPEVPTMKQLLPWAMDKRDSIVVVGHDNAHCPTLPLIGRSRLWHPEILFTGAGPETTGMLGLLADVLRAGL